MIASDEELNLVIIEGEDSQISSEMLNIMRAFTDFINEENCNYIVSAMFHTEPEIVTNFCKMFVKSTH